MVAIVLFLVYFHVPYGVESDWAVLAFVWLLPCVNAFMYLQLTLCPKDLWTEGALHEHHRSLAFEKVGLF